VIHWLDSVQGLPSQAQLAALAHGAEQSECSSAAGGVHGCTAAALRSLGVPNARLHIERFVSLPEDADDAPTVTADANAPRTQITVELDGAVHEVSGQSGELLIESLEAAGLQPPFSCRAGACAACMCHLEEGDVELVHNHVLSETEMNEGWISPAGHPNFAARACEVPGMSTTANTVPRAFAASAERYTQRAAVITEDAARSAMASWINSACMRRARSLRSESRPATASRSGRKNCVEWTSPGLRSTALAPCWCR